jgi:hypothetical protein
LPGKYYHKPTYYGNINNERYYSNNRSSLDPLDLKGRASTLCLPDPIQLKEAAVIGPSGSKLTKKQKWVALSKWGRKNFACES